MDIRISWCESIFWCKWTDFFTTSLFMVYPYRDAGQFSDASQRIFLLRHHSWIYPYHDVGQFSDASQRVFVYYVTIHGYTHIVMRVNFLMQVNCFFYYVTIHISWCGSIFWCKSTGFCLLRHHSWMYPYHDASQFSDASERIFLLRHHSWIYSYRDAGHFSDASQLIFLLRHHSWTYSYHDAGQFSDASQRVSFYYVTIHGYTHIMMRVNFLMQVNGFLFAMSLFMDIPVSWCGSIFWCKSTGFCLLRHHSWMYPYPDAGRFSDASQLIFLLHHHSWIYPYHDASQQKCLLHHFGQKPTCYVLISNQKWTVRNCVPMNEWRDNWQTVPMFGC